MNKKQRKRKEKKSKAQAQANSGTSSGEIPKPPHSEHAAGANPCNEDQKEGTSMKEPVSNWFMVAFTAALFITSLLQWWALRDTITSADRNFTIGDRAYIVVDSEKLFATVRNGNEATVQNESLLDKNGLMATDTPILEVSFVNSGHTPAVDVVITGYIDLSSDFVSDTPTYPPNPSARVGSTRVIGAGGTAKIHGPYYVDKQYQSALISGKLKLLIYGTVVYKDVFGTRRQTKFCALWNKDNSGMGGCPHHNSID